jgi:hypothetical protein
MAAGALALLAGCAQTPMGPTVQVMPGPGKSFDSFRIDQMDCRGYAEQMVAGQAQNANNRAVGGAVLTTALGAALGAGIGAAAGNAGAGAAIGAGAGAAGGGLYGANASTNEQYGIQQQYDNAFAQCMYSKGNQVPGWAPQASYAPPVMQSQPVVMADPLVRATQEQLIRLGFLQSGADGVMGPRTRNAISMFQQAKGFPVTGETSPQLLASMQQTPVP